MEKDSEIFIFERKVIMKTIANLIWFIFGGLTSAIMFLFLGIIWCITIIGIPFGKQAFKMAKLVLFPFGKRVNINFAKHPIANLLWFVFGGFSVAIAYLFVGLLYCVTIVGIPFGLQIFKLAKLAALPFGATVTG